MELALSLGDTSKPFKFLDKTTKLSSKDLGFCMGLGTGFSAARSQEKVDSTHKGEGDERRVSSDPPLQLDLLPFSPVPRRQPASQIRFPWLSDNCNTTLTYAIYHAVFLLRNPKKRKEGLKLYTYLPFSFF